ncbi:MAG: DUF104 domain-containing protein [Candidatus Omnitrophica bacterium]|nr:DUF104 domain-containing protein [Candidatus Omnitrophota bacterium]MCA9424286.1 DUF104 domain-containing protein [Candidatus Omnitrophota bacterium]MCA9431033.1 DUF104 domain-containing protein [Candidatus Omnitrophota bacterium]MCB9768732.1 DUF104 domain-containing protein [Candidatus Omnitrophota bacterium]MCB9784072.1 DUF104 domain-containing protein [Candidatus Omnitrophota bacterium]
MKQATPAIYENGVFRPLGKVDLEENSRVELSFESAPENGTSENKFPGEIQNLIGTMSEEEGREMMDAIEEAFERVDLDEWK